MMIIISLYLPSGPCIPERTSRLTWGSSRALEGVLAYFMHLKCQKHIGDDVGDLKYVFTNKKKFIFFGENDQPDTFYPTYYARI
jgi:hypothetical protein